MIRDYRPDPKGGGEKQSERRRRGTDASRVAVPSKPQELAQTLDEMEEPLICFEGTVTMKIGGIKEKRGSVEGKGAHGITWISGGGRDTAGKKNDERSRGGEKLWG